MFKKIMFFTVVLCMMQPPAYAYFEGIRKHYRQWWINNYLNELESLRARNSPDFELTFIKYDYYFDQVKNYFSPEQRDRYMQLSDYWEDVYEDDSPSQIDSYLKICKLFHKQLRLGNNREQSIIGLLTYIMKLESMEREGLLNLAQQQALMHWKDTFKKEVAKDVNLQQAVRSFSFHASGG